MTAIEVIAAVGADQVPREARARCTFERPHYADHFTIAAPSADERSPEEWARLILEETALGRSAPALWRALGLRLGPPGSAGHVQGWRIDGRGGDWLRLEARSLLMTGQAIVQRTEATVSLALFLRFESWLATAVWPPVAVLHRRAVPDLLRQGLAACEAR